MAHFERRWFLVFLFKTNHSWPTAVALVWLWSTLEWQHIESAAKQLFEKNNNSARNGYFIKLSCRLIMVRCSHDCWLQCWRQYSVVLRLKATVEKFYSSLWLWAWHVYRWYCVKLLLNAPNLLQCFSSWFDVQYCAGFLSRETSWCHNVLKFELIVSFHRVSKQEILHDRNGLCTPSRCRG